MKPMKSFWQHFVVYPGCFERFPNYQGPLEPSRLGYMRFLCANLMLDQPLSLTIHEDNVV